MSVAGPALVLLAGQGAAGTDLYAQDDPGRGTITWKVSGGDTALRPAAAVRLVIRNRIAPDEIRPDLGLIQSAVYFFASSSKGLFLLEKAAARRSLQFVQPDRELALASEAARVTVEPQGLKEDDYAVGLVLGRSIRVLGSFTPGATARDPGALRADGADLEERKHWSPETLIPAGEERVVWEGQLPLDVDRIYVSYLVVRNARANRVRNSEKPDVRRRLDQPDGGILELPVTATDPDKEVSHLGAGLILEEASGDRILPIKLESGRLNEVRVVAVIDSIGAYRVEIRQEALQIQR
ncbi:MAG: hypothetical protein ACE5ID_00350 [Acidobacteriota bacterium]